MSFLHEKQSRYFFIFNLLFCIILLSFSILLGAIYGQDSKKVLINTEQAIASSLIEQGVSIEVIATAFTNTSVSAEGTLFLQQINQTQATPVWFIPRASQAAISAFLFILVFMTIFSTILLIGTSLFLNRRESLYLKTNSIVMKFASGNFQEQDRKSVV